MKSLTDYQKYLRSDHWLELRSAKLESADWKCEKCKRKSNLQVHHISYVRLGKELLSDLMVLCERCHEKEHDLFPAYVDDWQPPKKKNKRMNRREQHPLFKYVKPLINDSLS